MFVKYTDEKIIIDGLLNESDWEKTIPASGFLNIFQIMEMIKKIKRL